MSIWFNKDLKITDLQNFEKQTLNELIGIEFTEIGPDFIRATMPVDRRTHQVYGILHGGASVVLAETLGSVAAAMVVDPAKFIVVGLEINANHIRSIREGFVTGTTTPKHIGSTTQVWEINIHDEEQRLICTSRITVAVLVKR